MIRLGIDYGRKKIGLAVSSASLAAPLQVLKVKPEKKILREIEKIIKSEKVMEVIIGVSEGKMADETKIFGKKLKNKLNIPVHFQDETLSTLEAQSKSIEAGIKRKKRKRLEDAFAATVILQNYIDQM